MSIVPVSGDILNEVVLHENTTMPTTRLLRLPSHPSYNTPPCEVLMPFAIRTFRRFPMHCAVTYNAGSFQELGTVWETLGWVP